MRRFLLTALALGVTAAAHAAPAQAPDTTTGPALSLAEAVDLAVRNNPDLLQFVSARRSAGAARRAAYGALLPSVDASLSSQYRRGGVQPINGVTFSTGSDIYQSSYWLGVTYTLNGATLVNPGLQQANLNAADADVAGSRQTVAAAVSQAYFTALQSAARADLQDTLVATTQVQVELARARAAAGAGTSLDIQRAEVALGQARVAALQARNQVDVDRLRLFQQMGVAPRLDVRLASTFQVTPVPFSLDSVLGLARERSPALAALEARERAASLGVRAARSSYLPTLQLSTGWGGYTYQYSNAGYLVDRARQGGLAEQQSCLQFDEVRVAAGLPSQAAQCDNFLLTDAQATALRRQNDQFPFDFARQPFGITASLSLPIFDGFAREQRVQEAQAQRQSAEYRLRAGRLQTEADVTAAYLTLVTQQRTVAIQQENAAKARSELQLAQERYRVGAAAFLDLADARAAYERAQTDLINAIYDYHKAFAALESAVGRPLR